MIWNDGMNHWWRNDRLMKIGTAVGGLGFPERTVILRGSGTIKRMRDWDLSVGWPKDVGTVIALGGHWFTIFCIIEITLWGLLIWIIPVSLLLDRRQRLSESLSSLVIHQSCESNRVNAWHSWYKRALVFNLFLWGTNEGVDLVEDRLRARFLRLLNGTLINEMPSVCRGLIRRFGLIWYNRALVCKSSWRNL